MAYDEQAAIAFGDPLTNEQRATLRKAITRHPDWTAWREVSGYTAADMTSSRCWDAARDLDIDVNAVLSADAPAPAPEPTPAPAPAPVPAPVAAPAADMDVNAALKALAQAMGGAISVDANQVRAIVEEQIKPLRDALGQPVIHVMDAAGARLGDLPPTRHPMADTLLAALSCKTAAGYTPNVWIAGPAGSGKTFAVKQIAQAMALDYGFHGAMSMAHELVGFVDAGGTYHETVFVRLYRNGGVCLLDECDAGSSEALLALNAALANGEMSLPNGEIIQRHKDFRCVAAANTYGAGATAEYVGRARIDAAFLDRFGVRLQWDYDKKLEQAICGNADWAKRVQKARAQAAKIGLKVLITPRASETGAALIAGGMSENDAAQITYLAGLSSEQKTMIEGAL